MINNINQKPCVVETPQGFSVSYKERFLYSKYNPSKLIIKTISEMEILEGTIFICTSPALCYGLKELADKLPKNCLIYLCEFDNELQDFSKNTSLYIQNKELSENKIIIFPEVEELYNLPLEIFDKAQTGVYKRVIRIDFSGGCQFTPDLYKQLEDACINSVKTFWTNRLTLTKFGRKYSYNFYKNLKIIGKTTPITSYFNKVEKPILIVGAGQSVDSLYDKIYDIKDNFFILCVDTIMSSLLAKNIIPDGVFVEEAQAVISKAFICKKYDIQLFSGLSSLPLLSQYFSKANISFFTTEYTKANFIENLKNKNLLPPVNPPFGSVGLTTVYYGLKFRKDTTIPIYITGLDFSYSTGYTHGKGTLAHKTRLINNNRLIPIENYNAAFAPSAIKFYDKNNNIFITTPALSNYCNLFNNLFCSEKNIYDISNCGIKLAIERKSLNDINNCQKNLTETKSSVKKEEIIKSEFSEEYKIKLNNYIQNEIKEIKELKSLLSEDNNLSKSELKELITKLAINKEYLYLHFPDGYQFTYSQSFLNRIRTEIDFFLKIFE